MEERFLSEKESFQLIRQMIQTAKREQKDDGRGWIIWGWLLFAASLLTVLKIRLKWEIDLFFFDISIINIGFSLLINLYAFWVLIYGTALNFKPSVVGAYLSWAIGLLALFLNKFEYVMLLHALAVLVGYIIPGHIANREFKILKRKEAAGV